MLCIVVEGKNIPYMSVQNVFIYENDKLGLHSPYHIMQTDSPLRLTQSF